MRVHPFGLGQPAAEAISHRPAARPPLADDEQLASRKLLKLIRGQRLRGAARAETVDQAPCGLGRFGCSLSGLIEACGSFARIDPPLCL